MAATGPSCLSFAADAAQEFRVDLGDRVRRFGLDADDTDAGAGVLDVADRGRDRLAQRAGRPAELEVSDAVAQVELDVAVRRLVQGVGKGRRDFGNTGENEDKPV